jgi:hypothetical protein
MIIVTVSESCPSVCIIDSTLDRSPPWKWKRGQVSLFEGVVRQGGLRPGKVNSLGNGKPMVFGGLTPASDPNNNGIVLANNVTVQGQTLANSLVTVSLDLSNNRTVVLNCLQELCTSETVEDNVLHWGNDQRTVKAVRPLGVPILAL